MEERAKELIAEVMTGTPSAKVLVAGVKPSGPMPGAEDWIIAQSGLTPPQIASMAIYMLADYFMKRDAPDDEVLKWYAGMAADQIGLLRRLRRRGQGQRPQLRVIPGGREGEENGPEDDDQ